MQPPPAFIRSCHPDKILGAVSTLNAVLVRDTVVTMMIVSATSNALKDPGTIHMKHRLGVSERVWHVRY